MANFYNVGTISGRTIQLTEANDTYGNAGTIQSSVLYLRGGNDIFNGALGTAHLTRIYGGNGVDAIHAGRGNATVYGEGGNDGLYGAEGNDILVGGAGHDNLWGGIGNDTLYGGTGADAFVFNTTLNAATNVDRIADFGGLDHIDLDNAVMPALGSRTGSLNPALFWKSAAGVAHDANDRIIYDTDHGLLYYDRDGTGPAARVLFARLGVNLPLDAADFSVM